MDIDKTYIGTSTSNFKWRKKDLPWLIVVWIACITWSYMESTIRPIIIIAIVSVIFFIVRLPIFERKIYIKINNGELSIHSKNAILWKTLLKDITSIDLEVSKRLIPTVAGKAILIRNNKNDSYFLPLDGVTFEGLNPAALVDELNNIKGNIA